MGKKILLTDDEPNIVKVVSVRLKAAGYEVVAAYDGEEAMQQVKAEKPDLILLDLMLPKIDGYKVCQMLKADPHYQHIPVILFSAKAQVTDKEMGREYGADGYIAKPFQPQQLLETIRNLLAV